MPDSSQLPPEGRSVGFKMPPNSPKNGPLTSKRERERERDLYPRAQPDNLLDFITAQRRVEMVDLLEGGASPIKRLGDLMRDEYKAALELLTENGPHEVKDARASARYLSGVKSTTERDYWEMLTSTVGPFVVYPGPDGTALVDRRR